MAKSDNASCSARFQVKKSGRNYFPCPTCRQPTNLPKNVRLPGKVTETFREDSFVSKLSEVIGAYRPDKSCDLCNRRDVTSPALNWWVWIIGLKCF